MRARLACNGPTQSWWGLDYRRGLLKESIYPSDAMGCVWLGFCKFSRLFLVPPSAVEGRRLSGTRGRAFQQLKGSPAAWRGCGAPNWRATRPAAPSSSHLHSPGESGEVPCLCRCPLLMWHQRTLACLEVSRKLSLHFAVGIFFCLLSAFLTNSSCWRKFSIANGRNFAVTQTLPTFSSFRLWWP